MTQIEIQKLAIDLMENWDIYRFENDWGSGDDRINVTHEMEREYYEKECFKMGLTDSQIEKVLEQIGF